MSERSGRTAFIGFTYGGKHSIEDYHVYRTSNGNRYDHNLIPQINDKVVDVPGGDGQYYFKTNYKTRQFSISIAFDDLDQQQFDAMKKWLNGKEIKPLVFDERTEVTYSAKVTGTPQLKYVCFDNNGTNIYKGEGTIQFTCYFPFGWQEDEDPITIPEKINSDTTYNLTIDGQIPTTFILSATIPSSGATISINNLNITVTSGGDLIWDTSTGLVKINDDLVSYTGDSYGTLEPGTYTVTRQTFPMEIRYKKLYY